MRVIRCLPRLTLAACVGFAVPMYGCGDDADPSPDGFGMQDSGASIAQPDASPIMPGGSTDGGGAKADAGSIPTGQDAALASDASGKPDASEGPKDASLGPTTDTGSSPQDGGTGPGKDGGPMGTADATMGDAGGDPCSLMAFIAGESASDDDAPLLEVNGGVTVRGVGCKQQWEGIVKVVGGRGLCTAAFISDRHLISASHCYARAGAASVQVSAPTWDSGMSHTFAAQVKLSGSNQSLDVSIIDLGTSVAWATPERRFVLHAGKASTVDMHLYGFGSGGSSGAAGTLRGVPNRATIRVTDNGRGNLTGKAGAAQLCTGDSGGPAFVEKTAPVLYGINQAIVPAGASGGRTCAAPDWTIMFTNVSAYMVFVETSIGKPCTRKQVDGLDVAQCW